jgi:hypothetical protein
MSEENSIVGTVSTGYEDDSDYQSGVYDNVRGDTYSEESSEYYFKERANLSSKNSIKTMRFNPATNKNVRVELFPTLNLPNACIKNAITGAFQGTASRVCRVGTADEDLFFSVLLSTGEFGKTAPLLFYDNPEQYERHYMTKLSDDLKTRWREKHEEAMYVLKSQVGFRPENTAIIVDK